MRKDYPFRPASSHRQRFPEVFFQSAPLPQWKPARTSLPCTAYYKIHPYTAKIPVTFSPVPSGCPASGTESSPYTSTAGVRLHCDPLSEVPSSSYDNDRSGCPQYDRSDTGVPRSTAATSLSRAVLLFPSDICKTPH